MAGNPLIDWFTGLGITTIIIVVIAFILIGLLLHTLFLYWALKLANAKKNTNFGSVFVTAILMALVGWIPCLGCILQWAFISARHDTGFLKAIGIWLLAGLLPIVIAIGIVFLIFTIAAPIFALPI